MNDRVNYTATNDGPPVSPSNGAMVPGAPEREPPVRWAVDSTLG